MITIEIQYMSLSKKFTIKIKKIETDRTALIDLLNETAEKKRKLKTSISRSSLKIKHGGLKTDDKARHTSEIRLQLSALSLEYEHIKNHISTINKKRRFENQDVQRYSSKLSQIFMVCAKRTLPANEFEKIEKQANKILEDRRNNIQTGS